MVFRYLPADKVMSYDRMVGVGKTYLLQASALPSEPTAVKWPYRGYYVAYYVKSVDEGHVASALEAASIPIHQTAPVLPDLTLSNGIACTASTPIGAVKAVADALIDGGIPIYVVNRATKRVETRRLQIQVLHYARAVAGRYRPLSHDDIDKLQSCPSTLGFFNARDGAKDHGKS
jgi:hypothetical protein